MILDNESLLADHVTLSSALTVSPNKLSVGKGEAYDPLKLATSIRSGTGTSPSLKVTIQTATDADFTTPVDLAEFTLSGTGNKSHSIPIPRGNLGYLRLSLDCSYTGGKLTSGLVADDDLQH